MGRFAKLVLPVVALCMVGSAVVAQTFEQALQAFDGSILAVVHDRYFLEAFAQEIWEVRGGSVRVEIV